MAKMPPSVLRNSDASGVGNPFEPRRDIDAVAIDIALVNYDVTDVDADAEFDPTIFGIGSVALEHGVLDFHGTTSCVDRAGKFD